MIQLFFYCLHSLSHNQLLEFVVSNNNTTFVAKTGAPDVNTGTMYSMD